MRLHRLQIAGFGPFAERVEVDVDAVAAHGLFLLHGATGAGKTSLLDAVCFALYGSVPGSRNKADRLTSDHGDPATIPEVVCEFTAGGRRLEVTRSPAWERPKSRGTGTTRQQASVLVRELVGGHWVARAERQDEAGLLLADVLGMAKEQFTKVVLLPQGDFAAFLRAGADERRVLLEKLFGTSRFTDVENWLAEQRNESRTALAELVGHRNDALARADEHARALPTYLGDELAELLALPDERADEHALRLVNGWRAAADEATEQAAVAAVQATAAARAARLDVATHTQRLHRDEMLAGDLRTLTALLSAADAQRETTEELARAERAERVRAPLTAADDAARQVRQAGQRHEASCLAAQELPALRPVSPPQADPANPAHPANSTKQANPGKGDAPEAIEQLAGQLTFDFWNEQEAPQPQIDDVTDPGVPIDLGDAGAVQGEVDARHRLVACVDALLDDEQSLTEDEHAIASLEQRRTGVADALTRRRADHAEAKRRHVAALARHGDLTARAAALTEHTLRRDAARAQASAATDLAELSPKLTAAVLTHQHAVEATLAARTHYLDLLQQRLDGMAGELARQLGEHQQCPVCGATEHPQPAAAAEAMSPQQVSSADDAVRARQDSERHAAQARTDLEQQVAVAAAGAGGVSIDDAHTALSAAAQALADSTDAAAALPETTAELADLEKVIGEAVDDLARLADAESTLIAQLAAAREGSERNRRRVDFARAGHACLADRRAALATELDLLAEVVDSHRGLTQARDSLDLAQRAADKAAVAAGFSDSREAAGALLEEAARTQRSAELRRHAEALSEVRGRLRGAPGTAVDDNSADPDVADPEHADDDGAVDVPPWADLELEAAGHALDALSGRLRERRPTLEHARVVVETAEQSELTASARHRELVQVARALTDLAAQVSRIVESTAPLRERHATLEELASTAHGLSASNARRLRLSAFVLEARLEQVAAAASERLQVMSGGRYLLLHSQTRRGAGRSGLGLRVMDSWTSRERDTASLSGGESFLASLALALGLADVVQAESGGLTIETLFVDEGFGSLDDDTLELVMQCLDQLREGGRAVGVVSHVGELRTRIPAQLHVVKGQHGSTVRLVEGVAS